MDDMTEKLLWTICSPLAVLAVVWLVSPPRGVLPRTYRLCLGGDDGTSPYHWTKAETDAIHHSALSRDKKVYWIEPEPAPMWRWSKVEGKNL